MTSENYKKWSHNEKKGVTWMNKRVDGSGLIKRAEKYELNKKEKRKKLWLFTLKFVVNLVHL